MYKYRTDGYGRYYSNNTLVKVLVEKETEKTVVVGGNRSHKRSEFYYFWDTFEEARDHLIKFHQDEIEKLKISLTLHEALLVRFTDITEDDLK